MITTVIGMTRSDSDGAATLTPSTEESTEMAGVIMLSPKNSEAPKIPSAARIAFARRPPGRARRRIKAISAMIPPSPSLSARITSRTYVTVTMIVTDTYVLLVMRADNDGEGGIMALIALIRRRALPGGRRAKAILAALGIFGASLFFGDSIITPAISVLSAIEGVKVAAPSLDELVVPITVVIIV